MQQLWYEGVRSMDELHRMFGQRTGLSATALVRGRGCYKDYICDGRARFGASVKGCFFNERAGADAAFEDVRINMNPTMLGTWSEFGRAVQSVLVVGWVPTARA